MGAWGIGIFEDDCSLDILDEFEEIEPLEFMREAFSYALSAHYLEYDEGIQVLVSAALIDAALNNTEYEILSDEYPHVVDFVKTLKLADLKQEAVKALEVVVSEKSELQELWSEAEEYDLWASGIEELIKRLM